jgi:hypothetical protein
MAPALKIHIEDIREGPMLGEQISHSTQMKSFSLFSVFIFVLFSFSLTSFVVSPLV